MLSEMLLPENVVSAPLDILKGGRRSENICEKETVMHKSYDNRATRL